MLTGCSQCSCACSRPENEVPPASRLHACLVLLTAPSLPSLHRPPCRLWWLCCGTGCQIHLAAVKATLFTLFCLGGLDLVWRHVCRPSVCPDGGSYARYHEAVAALLIFVSVGTRETCLVVQTWLDGIGGASGAGSSSAGGVLPAVPLAAIVLIASRAPATLFVWPLQLRLSWALPAHLLAFLRLARFNPHVCSAGVLAQPEGQRFMHSAYQLLSMLGSPASRQGCTPQKHSHPPPSVQSC